MADGFDFVETDSAALYSSLLTSLMEACSEPLYPGDERRIFGEALVQVLVGMYSLFNDAAKQRTLRYARGQALDAIGDFYDVERAQPASASATFRFTAAVGRTENIIIPEGTRITTDGNVYFATQEAAVLAVGNAYIDLLCVCTEGGAAYNGYPPESIGTLVDLIPYVESAANVTASAGGDDGEPYTDEGDEKYKERIRLSHFARSTAGPESAYRYWVLTADPDIVDVAIECPEDEPNTVNLYPLLTGGALPDEVTLQKILDVLADDVRPMTDKVQAMAPEVVEFEIELKYYCAAADEAATVQTVEGVGGAIDQFIEWQTSALNRDINPDQLRRFILAPASGVGAQRLDLVKPTFMSLAKNQVARLSGSPVVSHEVVSE